MSRPDLGPGRHENGQNFLTDRRVVAAFTAVVARTDGPIVEIGAGDGALTLPLARLGRPVRAIELHGPTVRRLTARVHTHTNVTVLQGDALHHRYPAEPFVIAGNLPFHLTTALLRRVLELPHWSDAVLLTQWEVARRRAGVGGASMLTASWWPWFEFVLHQRVPRSAFTPMPSVDGGLFSAHRRPQPLVAQRAGYQRLVQRVYSGRGHGLAQILPAATGLSRRQTDRWLASTQVLPRALPKDLTAQHWASLWQATTSSGCGPRSSARSARRSR